MKATAVPWQSTRDIFTRPLPPATQAIEQQRTAYEYASTYSNLAGSTAVSRPRQGAISFFLRYKKLFGGVLSIER